MKTRTSITGLFASLGAASLVALGASAQTPAPTPAPSTPAVTAPVPAKLPYGADDVLKLSRAQVSDDVTVNFIRNSGTIYNLGPNDIVYLRNQGVSERVINTMLDQRKTVPAETAAQNYLAPAPAAPQAPDGTAAPAVQYAPQYAPQYAQPAPVYVEPQAPASTVYVIPYSGGGYGYSSYYPYYGGYSYYGHSVVFGFGYGGHGYYGGHYYRGGYSHAGYYRGGYTGGGYHGGGHYGHR
jgi:hypothetical protein